MPTNLIRTTRLGKVLKKTFKSLLTNPLIIIFIFYFKNYNILANILSI